MPEVIRLSKLMAQRGLCSRREADALIAEGLVRVDGAVVNLLGSKVPPTANVELERRGAQILERKITILLNKPVGYVSSQPEKGYSAAVELITAANQIVTDRRQFKPADRWDLATAGRLDIDSRGLLILTQDGALVRRVIGPESRMEKEYHVSVDGRINEKVLQLLCHGLSLDGVPLRPAKVDQLGPGRLRFILQEGRKRQIRRMCELVDLGIRSLLRVRIGRLHLRDLPEGRWRYLGLRESP